MFNPTYTVHKYRDNTQRVQSVQLRIKSASSSRWVPLVDRNLTGAEEQVGAGWPGFATACMCGIQASKMCWWCALARGCCNTGWWARCTQRVDVMSFLAPSGFCHTRDARIFWCSVAWFIPCCMQGYISLAASSGPARKLSVTAESDYIADKQGIYYLQVGAQQAPLQGLAFAGCGSSVAPCRGRGTNAFSHHQASFVPLCL